MSAPLPSPAARARDVLGHRLITATVALTLAGAAGLAAAWASEAQRSADRDAAISRLVDETDSLRRQLDAAQHGQPVTPLPHLVYTSGRPR